MTGLVTLNPAKALVHWAGGIVLGAARSCSPVAELPVLQVISAVHILADLTLGLGKVVHDYMKR